MEETQMDKYAGKAWIGAVAIFGVAGAQGATRLGA